MQEGWLVPAASATSAKATKYSERYQAPSLAKGLFSTRHLSELPRSKQCVLCVCVCVFVHCIYVRVLVYVSWCVVCVCMCVCQLCERTYCRKRYLLL